MKDIPETERALAALVHLSGLASYLIPLGGIVVPLAFWLAKRDSRTISAIAKQAIMLNVAVFLAGLVIGVLYFTLILIPILIPISVLIGAVAVVLPIVGAVRAFDGRYYRYPLVGDSL